MAEMSFKDRVSLLLGGLEEGREVRAYLRRFRQQDEECFAIIKVGGAIIEESLEALADALALLQFLNLPPVVIFGAGPQLNDALEAAGFPEERRDGLRVTPEGAMPLVAKAVAQMGMKLSEAMRLRGASSLAVPAGIITGQMIDTAKYGSVGDVASVEKQPITDLLSAGIVPLIGCVQADGAGRLLNMNADGVATSLCRVLRPQKMGFVTGTGGLLDPNGQVIDSVNLATDEERLFSSDWLRGGMAHKVREIADLLKVLPLSSSVSITSARGVVRELFTHTGSGTLIRQGEAIEEVVRPTPEDFGPLIEAAFDRPLKASYWQNVDARYALLSGHRRAGAIVTKHQGIDLLDKFAVVGAARGEGLAKTLWAALQERSPRMIWRSRQENAFNGFYAAHADGFVRRGAWTIFWRGSGIEDDLRVLADGLAVRPGDFEGEA